MKICSKKFENLQNQKEIPKVFMAFTHTKKVQMWSFIKARIRIRPKRSGAATLVENIKNIKICLQKCIFSD
jgi:hypothetical protein